MSTKKSPEPKPRQVPIVLVWLLVVAGVGLAALGAFQVFGPVEQRNVAQGWISAFLGIACTAGGINELVQRRRD